MVASLVAANAQEAQKLAIPPVGFALLAIAFFAFLLLVTFAFRSVGHRH